MKNINIGIEELSKFLSDTGKKYNMHNLSFLIHKNGGDLFLDGSAVKRNLKTVEDIEAIIKEII